MKGFYQQEGIDYIEIFTPITKMNFVRLILSLASHFRWEIYQMDVKSAFLHGNLYEVIYMQKTLCFMTDSILVFRLQNLLYGLK